MAVPTAFPETVDVSLDVPRPARRDPRRALLEVGGSVLSSLVLTLLVFHRFLLSGLLGFLLVWYGGFLVIHWLVVRDFEGEQDASDRLASVLIGTGASVALVALIAILYTVVVKGASLIITTFPGFFIHDLAQVGPQDPASLSGAKHAIIGTLEQVLIATAATVPLAILTAVYLNEIGGRLQQPVRFVVDAMSGVPSIVAGLFIYNFWVIDLDKHFSGIAGSMALVILMLPSVTRTAEEVLKIVPPGLREAALALGAPEWRMIAQIVLPTARTGLVTASILGVARAVGETAPMLMTAFGSKVVNLDPTKGPQSDLPTFVYDLIHSAKEVQIQEAWAGALVLIVLVLSLFILARLLAARAAGGRSARR